MRQRAGAVKSLNVSGRHPVAAVKMPGGMMSTRALALMSFAAMILLGGVAIFAQARRPGDTMQLWEYRTEVTRDRGVPPESRGETHRSAGSAADATLNRWGDEGWELVGVTRREVRVDDTIQTETLYAFKRPTRVVNR
jgi:hypothetical protein